MTTAGSPPKPWERAGAGATSAALPASTPITAATPTSAGVPEISARPDSLNAVASRTASTYSTPLNRPSPYASSPYGGAGMGGYGASSFSSPYNRMGGMGGMGGGMYGSSPYGGMGMGGGMYGGGMYGAQGGMYGQQGGMMPEQSLSQTMSMSTQATFQMIESIVGAFGGFAQMLESTYMATHSSFFAMVSVAEQFGNLRQTLGSILGIFTVMRWIRTAIAKVTGRPPPASSTELTPANFAAFSGQTGAAGSAGAQPKPSRKPFIVFMLAVFGLPYLMGKLIKALAASQQSQLEQQQQQLALTGQQDPAQPLDPSKLDFCRVLYTYTPAVQPGLPPTEGVDLAVKEGDLVAVLDKSDPVTGAESDWWRCRARDGRMGYLPKQYLETIQRKHPQAQIAGNANVSPASSRLNTMTSKAGSEARTNSMKIGDREKVAVRKAEKGLPGKAMDESVEGFQRGGFYS